MRPNKRDELVSKALDVFYRDGFHATGMDKLVVETGVSKTSMYKHFRTKDDLILATMRLRDERFRNWFYQRVAELASTPDQQLLAAFDALGEWLAEDSFRGCMFIKAGAEFQEKDHPVHQQSAMHKRQVFNHLSDLARAAGYAAPDMVATQLTLLTEGAIAMAVMLGSPEAAQDAKKAAGILLQAASKREPAQTT